MAKESKRKNAYPEKRTMNLYYKPDRTTFPATVALYVLFVLALLLAFGKFFVYDILQKYEDTKVEFAQVQAEKSAYDEKLENYDEVLHRYQMYSSTDEEDRQTDRMDVLGLLDETVRPYADLETVSIADGLVRVRFSGVTLRETAEIVRSLDRSPIVMRTTVSTAATVENTVKGAGRTAAPTAGQSGAAEESGQTPTAGQSGSAEEGGQTPTAGQSGAGNLVTADILIALKKESGEGES